MESASEIINQIMDKYRFRHKRDVAQYFGVTPQALSIWIAKNQIPPKHLLKLSRESSKDKTFVKSQTKKQSTPKSIEELESVIDYLMRENISLKEDLLKCKEKSKREHGVVRSESVFDRISADTLYISGRLSDGIITDLDGRWEEVMGYKYSELKGKGYDRESLIHPDDLKGVKKIEQNIKQSTTISLTRYSTIQRWRHGKTDKYIMLSMVWDVNVEEDIGLVVCKPIDGFISA
tara:strand:+ start:478 stop:1179 length:702 start_codon:yes stop_codon:yes gene_type:complete